VDVLVTFDPDHIPGWEMVSIEDELRKVFGRDVDLGTPDGLNRHIRDRILDSAQVIYERTG
jgi:hypothetical protein